MRVMTREVKIGNKVIGGSNKIAIQSMTNTKTEDYEETSQQLLELERAGCDIIRVTVNSEAAAKNIAKFKKVVSVPLVADIHYDYRLALKAIENGIDKLRINPGNIGSKENIKRVVEAAKNNNIPIRIGVNGGSLEKELLEKYGYPTAEAMVESALNHIKLLEEEGFYDIVVSLKASDVKKTVRAYRQLAAKVDYPLHLGITEAGTIFQGTVKSAIGIGSLLLDGIGSTMRVSLTANPVEEIKVAKEILKVLGLGEPSFEIISCPTCGRTEVELIPLAERVESYLRGLKYERNLKIAVMGCVVNGPGEAREADYGVAAGKGVGVLFKKGKMQKTVSETDIQSELIKMIEEGEKNEKSREDKGQ